MDENWERNEECYDRNDVSNVIDDADIDFFLLHHVIKYNNRRHYIDYEYLKYIKRNRHYISGNAAAYDTNYTKTSRSRACSLHNVVQNVHMNISTA